ncbi:hypothetical protein NECID01_0664 [Nematocida sp. AWRm77]|nr:hypothetical protein NECID01_0664 [Nematocida sp. AWRm77]
MESAAKKACCLRILDVLGEIKYMPLEKEVLERSLLEINRLISLVEKHTVHPPVKVEEAGSVCTVGETVVCRTGAEVKVLSTSIPGLEEYLLSPGTPNYTHSVPELVEYLTVVQENRVCLECLHRSCLSDATLPLVVVGKDRDVRVYHVLCYEKVKNKDTL